MDALELLLEDHARIRNLLERASETEDPDARGELFQQLKGELMLHERKEEEVLYPALQNHPRAREIVLEGYEEHHVADTILHELEATDTSDERWAAKLKVLKENLEHHIEEEEKEMFDKARQVFDRNELKSLGERMTRIGTPAD